MNPQARDVYVPGRRPDEAAGTADRGDVWPRPVFTPGERRAERTLAARVREALGPEPRPRGAEGPGGRVAALFRSPEVAREVVGRLSREARERGCTAVVAVEPGGGLVGAPVAVEAGLPLVLVGGAEGRPEGRAARAPGGDPGEGGDDVPLLGADDGVLLVDGVADSGERIARAARRVEAAGARVAAAAVVVEVAGGGARDRVVDHNLISITTLQ